MERGRSNAGAVEPKDMNHGEAEAGGGLSLASPPLLSVLGVAHASLLISMYIEFDREQRNNPL